MDSVKDLKPGDVVGIVAGWRQPLKRMTVESVSHGWVALVGREKKVQAYDLRTVAEIEDSERQHAEQLADARRRAEMRAAAEALVPRFKPFATAASTWGGFVEVRLTVEQAKSLLNALEVP